MRMLVLLRCRDVTLCDNYLVPVVQLKAIVGLFDNSCWRRHESGRLLDVTLKRNFKIYGVTLVHLLDIVLRNIMRAVDVVPER